MKIKAVDKYIQLYDVEKYLFQTVGPSIKKKRFLTFKDFYQICMWKSARPKTKYITNKKRIKEISKRALKEGDENKRIKILCELNGVGIPTASAILAITYPEKYAVIDIRCLETLDNLLNIKINKNISVNTWIKYTQIMRTLAQENNITPRELDMALFAMHRKNSEKQNYKNLYKTKIK
jgi:thermostable 8-oxoguanine DNA glycosylase